MHNILFASIVATLVASPVFAQSSSPAGLWKNIDDVTGKPKALIRIVEVNGEMQGRIEKLFLAPGEDPNPRCTNCSGTNKDKPVIGMLFMSGLRKDGNEYKGGEIIDPDSGKVYRSKMTLIEGGNKLDVRGYVGVPMFGRSQVWVRQQ